MMDIKIAFNLLCQAGDGYIATLTEPARSATLEKIQEAAKVLASALVPKPAAPPRPAPIVNPATGDFPTEEPEVSDGNVA